ncbi:hypothetical protein [Streptomyces sp. McG3]|uniref:hypothetical protein n=1 Tax=Streptomyces sp. McG3 TaxID=2725483 RepID=UPI002036B0DE|nr:hypothetical protein [Streptomyces sp. McG3]
MPGITSGTFGGTFHVPNRSCLTLAGAGTSTSTITWNTGQNSTLSLNFTTTIVGAVYTSVLTGPATDVLLCTLGLGTVSGIHTVGVITFV